MKAPRIALVILSLAALGACADGSSITSPAPGRPALNGGGFGMGSGGITPNDSTGAQSMDAPAPVTPDSSDGRGGFGMGSGG